MKNLKIKNFKTKKNQKLLKILIKFQKCWPNSRISTKLNHFGPLGEPRIAHTAENGPKHKLTLLNFASLRWSGVLLASLASDLNSALQGSCACIFVAGNLSKYRRGRNLNPGGAMQWMMTRTRRTTPAQLLWSPPSILHDLKCLKYPPCVDLTRPMGIFKAQLWSLYKVVLGNMSTIPVLRKIVI